MSIQIRELSFLPVVIGGLIALAPHVCADGGVPLWTNRFAESVFASDYRACARAIAVDGNGNVFVTGEASFSYTQSHYVTVAYSSAGVPLWTNRYAGAASGQDKARAIAVDANSGVFVTGTSATTPSSPYDYDYATVKYSGTGTPSWTNFYSGWGNGGNDGAYAAAVDTNGNAFVTGASTDSQYPPYYAAFATVAYSGTGVRRWATTYGGLVTNCANAIALDSSSNVFVTGSSAATGSANADYATVCYSSTGVELWAKTYNGPGNSTDIARAIAVDAVGNVFVTGYSAGVGSGYELCDYKVFGRRCAAVDQTLQWNRKR